MFSTVFLGKAQHGVNHDNDQDHQRIGQVSDCGGEYGCTDKHQDEDALVEESWKVWNIAIQEFADGDVDLTRVKKLIVGVSGNGGLGTLFIDDIRLYPPRCLPEYAIASFNDDCMTDLDDLDTLLRYWLAADYDVAAVEPDNGRLQAHYKFNETSGTVAGDSSGKGYDATVDPNGAGAWAPAGIDGYCLAFDGTFGVTVPEDVFAGIDNEITVSVWVYVGAEVNPNTVGRADFGAGPAEPNEPWDRVAWVQDKPAEHLGQWNHYAFIKDAGEGMMRIYHNGVLAAQDTNAFLAMDGAAAGPVAALGCRVPASLHRHCRCADCMEIGGPGQEISVRCLPGIGFRTVMFVVGQSAVRHSTMPALVWHNLKTMVNSAVGGC